MDKENKETIKISLNGSRKGPLQQLVVLYRYQKLNVLDKEKENHERSTLSTPAMMDNYSCPKKKAQKRCSTFEFAHSYSLV